MQVLMRIADAVDTFTKNEVPDRYWKERLKYMLKNRELLTLTDDNGQAVGKEEVLQHIDNVVREITEQYVQDKQLE